MSDIPVFNFVPEHRRDVNEQGERAADDSSRGGDKRRFEPTRDGWRAYQAWCKRVREDWKEED